MSDTTSTNQKVNLPPPEGERDQAERYLRKITQLINQNKITVAHTDLKKFDLTSLHDHYSITLEGYEVELSHTKQPDSGKDFYVMLFNNIRQVKAEGATCVDKLILAYTHLSQEQFQTFKRAADDQIEKKRREEEAKRFKEAMSPVDQLLENLTGESTKHQHPESHESNNHKPYNENNRQETPRENSNSNGSSNNHFDGFQNKSASPLPISSPTPPSDSNSAPTFPSSTFPPLS